MKVALVGNPNCGKTSLFNQLTGLRQKVGNFPGVTVDKKIGFFNTRQGEKIELTDLPGTYSVYPNSLDEAVVLNYLLDKQSTSFPDLLIFVFDASNLKRSLLLYDQVKMLGIPLIGVLNQVDEAANKGIAIKEDSLAELLKIEIISINAREGFGIEPLKTKLDNPKILDLTIESEGNPAAYDALVDELKSQLPNYDGKARLLLASQADSVSFLNLSQKKEVSLLLAKHKFNSQKFQTSETLERYKRIADLLKVVERKDDQVLNISKWDQFLLHRVWGYVAFIFILLVVFQSVFSLANYPMDWIDAGVAYLAEFTRSFLPAGYLNDLITDGLIAGIGGIIIFVPQIALLFGFITIMEETGYMARVIVLMDRIVRPFGMSGRSVVPLMSGMACAVPAIMSARTIGGWRERIITIMVTPLMSCSARLPIYTILIALVVPNDMYLGFIGLQGIALMFLYLVGFLSALGAAWVMKVLVKSDKKTLFFMELPSFKPPRWTEVWYTILEKTKTFLWDAGRVILVISLILWVLSTFGPGDKMQQAEQDVISMSEGLTANELDDKIAAERLKNSYAGHFGRAIEPVIKPLGYDWKMGIALIASFAAREVFVGTISTIYSIGSYSEEEQTIKERLRKEKNPETGEPMYNVATSFSLLVFYVFAMMCMSTIAIVYRETKGWKWPLIQLLYMTALAYISAWVVYNVLS